MATLTCRERLKRTFRCEPVDRMPIRIWGVDPEYPSGRVSWSVLYELITRHELDIFRTWHPAPEEQVHAPIESHSERVEAGPDLWEVRTITRTPKGELTQVRCQPRDGSPGYTSKHLIESPEDARRWLSLPDAPGQPRVDSYFEMERRTGCRALLMVGIGEAMYTVQALMGSEVFGYWLADERELLHEMIDVAYNRLAATVRHYLAAGLGDAYGWVGPELCIPPLAGPADFREFVFDYDKRIIDMVHDAGKLVWVHCHGDMAPVLEGFIEMGVDCLNPIEPPPVGRLTLAEAKAVVQGRMALDGGVEDGAFDTLRPEAMARLTEDAVRQLKPGGGFILCPTSAPTTWPELSEKHAANYRAFIETGIRLAAYE